MKRLCAPSALTALLALCLLAAAPTPASAQGGDGVGLVIENRHVLAMVAAGIASEVIVEKIRTSACSFDTFPPVLAELKSKGVPDAVLYAMVRAPHGPTSVEQEALGEINLHPVSEVLKYSSNYVRTRKDVRPASRPARNTNARRRS